MLDLLFMGAAGLFMIGTLVIAHEAGHFVVARLFGVGTPVFSVGMGHRLFGFRWWDTDFRISMFPIGGYVRMAGADPFGEQSEDEQVPPEQDFMLRPVWQRFLIMGAGPAVNLALPLFVFTGLLMLGRPEVGPEVGRVFSGTAADRAGLRAGDVIRSVNGEPVEVWHDVVEALREHVGAGTSVELSVERAGGVVPVALPPDAVRPDAHGELDRFGFGAVPYDYGPSVGIAFGENPARRAGVRLGDWIEAVDGEEVGTWSDLIARLSGDTHTIRVVRVVDKQLVREDLTLAGPGEASAGPYANRWGLLPATLFVTHVDPESAADKAGILAGDRLTAVDGREVLSFDHLRDLVAWSAPGGVDPRPVKVELERDGQQVTVELTPSWRLIKGEARMRPIMGVGSAGDTPVYVGTARRYYSLFEAVPRAWDETVAAVDGTAALLGNLLMVRGDPRDNLGGVISIFYTAGKVAERGFFEYATMLSMISVSLGLFNLLPVPVLDGGQMLFYLVEAVRGRPIALEIRERLLMAGALGMAVLVVLVFFLDVQRMVGG